MQKRLGDMRELLTKHDVDALLVSSLEHIVHLTDFSYFSNSEREAYLLITQNSQYIFTDGRYTHAVKKLLKNFSLQEITTQKPFINHFKDLIAQEKIS
ncbi:MAG TPA: aminopeptidase P family N-terminal domain-containing protein, partial [Patescibacteria group bacterium]|nr:aminopeptidase P family N-terminal domain-containing protein [Patescibacteria group bacterium]